MLFNEQARTKIKKGADQLANAVKVTLGPKGRNVVIDKQFGTPQVTKDGVTVAKEVEVKNEYEKLGAELIKEAASKTNDHAGDGTTTATVLAQAMIDEGLKQVSAGISPIDIKRQIDSRVKEVVAELKKTSKPVSDVAQVGAVSGNDKEIGRIIAETMKEVGEDGVITVEEGQLTVEKEVVKGMQFDRGYTAPFMAQDSIKEPHILVTDKNIASVQEILPLLEALAGKGKKNLLIVSDGVSDLALRDFAINKARGSLNVVAVNAPGFGDQQKETLRDIASLSEAQFISNELGHKLEEVTLEDLGTCKQAIVTKDTTTIVGGREAKDRIKIIREDLKLAESDFEKDQLKTRLARLTGGVGVIKVGASTEAEMNEKKDRIVDAVNATQAAVEEGIVEGGGCALARLATKDTLVDKAMKEPIKQIAENAGKDGSMILSKVLDGDGYNASTDTYEDLYKAGIVDPTKVVRLALENASSVASMFLTTEVVIVKPKEEEKLPVM